MACTSFKISHKTKFFWHNLSLYNKIKYNQIDIFSVFIIVSRTYNLLHNMWLKLVLKNFPPSLFEVLSLCSLKRLGFSSYSVWTHLAKFINSQLLTKTKERWGIWWVFSYLLHTVIIETNTLESFQPVIVSQVC